MVEVVVVATVKPNLLNHRDFDHGNYDYRRRPRSRFRSPFTRNGPLQNVTFAIAGFKDEDRKSIRDTGEKLGAIYDKDFTDETTHLM